MVSPGGGDTLPHTYSQNHLHVVFSTKERRRLIRPEMQPKLWAYLAGIARNHDFLVLANGGMEDHVHLLIQLPPALSLAMAVSTLKSNSSSWMSEHGSPFAWQEGYGAFSVSASNLKLVENYIANQERHHRKITFEDEFIGLLRKHGISFDPKYVFG
ncbi:MAG TPA: IS200/IS605 family transposase [Candidatus Angelobacter sp.]|jgi:REP element-mobilizing transposase RayT|nr:IS200/IS605 family transposase [Candidatus Angelobacter sp.]